MTEPAAQATDTALAEPPSTASARGRGEGDFRSAFLHAPIGMCLTTTGARLLNVNPALSELLGLAVDDLVGTTLIDHAHPEDRPAVEARCTAFTEQAEATTRFDCRVVRRSGGVVPVRVSAAKIPDTDGGVSHLVVHIQDITDHHNLTDSLRQQALHDPLTMLPNRELLIDRLEHALSRYDRNHRPLTVLYLDLDQFKRINDFHGHAVGDAVLIAVAGRLTSVLRTGDTVARLGGDEFVVVCEDTEAAQAVELSRRLGWAVAEPFEINDVRLRLSASIGTVTTEGPTPDASALLHEADTAMYEVKRSTAGTRR